MLALDHKSLLTSHQSLANSPVPRRTLFELAAIAAVLLLAALAFHAWLASHDEQQRLQATLAAQKQLLDAADAREQAREATLHDTLAQIETLKHTTQTPAQILRGLPQFLPLPQPITLAGPAPSVTPGAEQGTARPEDSLPLSTPSSPLSSNSSATNARDLPAAPSAQLPVADLKPLYDFVQDCRACQAQLAVARQNAADDAAKIAALTVQRDAAITAAKGGSFWRRLRRNSLVRRRSRRRRLRRLRRHPIAIPPTTSPSRPQRRIILTLRPAGGACGNGMSGAFGLKPGASP
jgi:type II secretory pathway pseudopilin PulG